MSLKSGWAAILAGIVISMSFAVQADGGPAAARALIEKTIRASIGWALNKDRPLLESVLAHDDRLFMFQPDSRSTIAGWDQFVKQFDSWMDPRFKATRFEIRDLRIDVSRSGNVAWWACVLDDLGEWDGKPVGWKDARWTGVLEKREKRWVIVQMHFSLAADKVQAKTPGTGPLESKPAASDVRLPGDDPRESSRRENGTW